ncbi:DNAj-like protein [Cryptosporidium canis]|nr:DNAj-like protein [Cryptosporidium canis]
MLSDRLRDYHRSRSGVGGRRSAVDDILVKESGSLGGLGLDVGCGSLGVGSVGVGGGPGSEDVSSRVSYSPSVASNDSKTKSDYVRTLRSQSRVYGKRGLISDQDELGGDGPDCAQRRRIVGDSSGCDGSGSNSPMSELRVLNKRVLISYKYYDVLELQPGSSLESIKKAYRKKASKLHPDKQRSVSQEQREQSLAKFRQVQESYEFLSNPNKKEVYDEYGDDIIKYGFLDHWNDMKGIFETKVPNNSNSSSGVSMDQSIISSGNQGKSGGFSDWEAFWQDLLVYLFFKPILKKSCIELRDLPPMNISVCSYRTLISSSYSYLRRLLSMPNRLFGDPVVIKLDPQDISASSSKALPALKKGLFSRLADHYSSQSSKIPDSFLSAQVIGSDPSCLQVSRDSVGLRGASNRGSGTSKDEAFGAIFCESEQGWAKFLSLSKREFENKSEGGNNFKRRLKEIQAEFDWIILVFVSEEQLPTQDQELLLDYYNIKDDIKETKSCENPPADLDIIEQTAEASDSSDLFPCLILKPKSSNTSTGGSDISYSRPSNTQINQIIRQLDLLSNIQENLPTHPIIEFISNDKQAPTVGKGGSVRQ